MSDKNFNPEKDEVADKLIVTDTVTEAKTEHTSAAVPAGASIVSSGMVGDDGRPLSEFKPATPEIEKAIKAGLVVQSPDQLSPEQAAKLSETWTTHDDWASAPKSIPEIIERAWNDVRGTDPEFSGCIPSFQQQLLNAGAAVLGGSPPDFSDSPIGRFEVRVFELKSLLNVEEKKRLDNLPSNRIL